MLIQNMGVRTQAAEALFLHRNTLLYRIRKIEQLLNCDLSNGEELIKLAIALKVAV
ncbi:protein containing Helix-turn-helix, Fis-type domain protein [gut metagenome]|uniref:Protein containing Helix-turn-helix, Fis-type domain protein n=1 Tax=gut metagenome TaxID=749906 RepID=J9FVE7_9ZZZZ